MGILGDKIPRMGGVGWPGRWVVRCAVALCDRPVVTHGGMIASDLADKLLSYVIEYDRWSHFGRYGITLWWYVGSYQAQAYYTLPVLGPCLMGLVEPGIFTTCTHVHIILALSCVVLAVRKLVCIAAHSFSR